MSIFQKKTGYTDYFDRMMIAGYPFDASIRVRSERGDPSAIHCGRIVTFELLYENSFVAYFDDGEWQIEPDQLIQGEIDPEFYDAVILARDLLIQKWSNPEKIRIGKCEVTDLF